MNELKQTATRPTVLSVSELNLQARVTIEKQFNVVWVEGELSNFARPRSGHWYFTLKDDSAQIRCAMFVNRNRLAQIQPSDGQQVLIKGRVSIYEGRGDFQIIVDQIEHAGEGLLRQAFEKLKIKLSAEGLFSPETKKPLPAHPAHAIIVSSPTGAAVKDILAVWRRRYPLLQVTLVPTAVQGDEAPAQIVNALKIAERLHPDVVILTRGGGSLEDLWSFNVEEVARAIFNCQVPVISAVGHEIDFTIADLVADTRAPTPSAAAEIAVPDLAEISNQIKELHRLLVNNWDRTIQVFRLKLQNAALRLISPKAMVEQAHQRIDDTSNRLTLTLENTLARKADQLSQSRAQLRILGPGRQLQRAKTELSAKTNRLLRVARDRLSKDKERLASLTRVLESVSPLPTISRGYAIVQDEKSKKVITQGAELRPGQKLTTHITDSSFTSTVESIDNETSLLDKQ